MWLSGLSANLLTERLPVRFPLPVHTWVLGQVPSWDSVRGSWLMFLLHINCFFLSLSPSPTLKIKINKIFFKIQERYLGSEECQPHIRPPSPGFQCQEDKSPWILSANTSRDWVSERKFWNPKKFPLKAPQMNLLRLTPSELQHEGSSLKGTNGIQGETEVSDIEVGVGEQLSPTQKGGQRPSSFFWTLSHKATEPAGWCHFWDSSKLANTVFPALDSQKLCPT